MCKHKWDLCYNTAASGAMCLTLLKSCKAFHMKFRLKDCTPTHMEMFVFQHDLTHPFKENVPGKFYPHVDHLLCSWLFWLIIGKPHSYGHGNLQQCADHSVTVSTCSLKNILIIPRKWLNGTPSRGCHLQRPDDFLWNILIVNFNSYSWKVSIASGD